MGRNFYGVWEKGAEENIVNGGRRRKEEDLGTG
jgi:hypothetical protein